MTLTIEGTRYAELREEWNDLALSVNFARQSSRTLLLGWLIGKGIVPKVAWEIVFGAKNNGWDM